jgi:hypothetical protein
LLNNNGNNSNSLNLVNNGLNNVQVTAKFPISTQPQIQTTNLNTAPNSISVTPSGSFNSATNAPSGTSSNSTAPVSTSLINAYNPEKNSSSTIDQFKSQSNTNQLTLSTNSSLTSSTLNKGKNISNVNPIEKATSSNLTINNSSSLVNTNTPSSSSNNTTITTKISHNHTPTQENQHLNKTNDLFINSNQKRKRESIISSNSNNKPTNNVSTVENSPSRNLNHKPSNNEYSNLNSNKISKNIDQQFNNKNPTPVVDNHISAENMAGPYTDKIYHTFNSNPSFSWSAYLESQKKISVAPVYAFKHVPMSSLWKKIMHHTNIEIPNRDPPPSHLLDDAAKTTNDKNFYWFASIIYFAGYLAKVRYLGFDNDSSCDFWIHMCDPNIHPVGWAAENNFLIVPPYKIVKKYSNWKDYLMKHLAGKKTLPSNYHKRVN